MANMSLVTIDKLPDFAKSFSKNLKSGDVVSLSGNLGTGKTTFLRALMTVLGMRGNQGFSSPTFTILNQYHLKNYLVNHFDLYRLHQFSEFKNLDFIAFFHEPKAITFIEWGDKFGELESYFTKKIHFEYTQTPDARQISVMTVCKKP